MSVLKILKSLCYKPFLVQRLHGGEQKHITDAGVIRHEHHHAVDADAQTACGGHCWAKAQRDKGFQALTISTKASIIHPSTPLERS